MPKRPQQIDVHFLRRLIECTLSSITETRHPLYSVDAQEMLIMIAAHESKMGRYVEQIGGGPAVGIYQIEPATMEDNYDSFLAYRRPLRSQVARVTGVDGPCEGRLKYDLVYSTIHARLKLYRSPGALPGTHDKPGMAAYCKKYFNSSKGKASAVDYINAYVEAVGL